MRKTQDHFEQVPVGMAEMILEKQLLSVRRNRDRRFGIRKSRSTRGVPIRRVTKGDVSPTWR
jgi:hypothetical protein